MSICTGAIVLGKAGLLDGRRCTTHWSYVDDLQDRFPKADVVCDVLYVEDGPVLTSAGTAAGLDLGGREDLVATLSVLAMDEFSPATILVSHHVEEIPPGFTHALMLREGRVTAAGPLPEVMTEEVLSATFGMRLLLREEDGRYSARRRAGRHA